MTFVAEDGTGLEDANSLVNVEYADAYFALRGVESWDFSVEEKQQRLVVATDYIHSRFRLVGTPKKESQGLHFPTRGEITVPGDVKKACCEYALVKPDLFFIPKFDNLGRQIISKSVNASGVSSSVTYAPGESRGYRHFPHADRLMRRYVAQSGMVIK